MASARKRRREARARRQAFGLAGAAYDLTTGEGVWETFAGRRGPFGPAVPPKAWTVYGPANR